MVLGAQSQREVLRSRHRTSAAMRAQAREQGRFLGGRPPYGYRLVDAGPHPNRAHARWGRQLQRLDPDPATSPYVQWMFEQRLAGRSVASIARELTELGVPCPSAVDPERNRHRNGDGWTLRTVAVILGNPRYTGRQVWNRQRPGSRHSVGSEQTTLLAADLAISATAAHPALVAEADFIAAQRVHAGRPTRDGGRRRYLLSGLIRCGVRGRRMDSHWVHGRAGYRCRHGHSSSHPRTLDHSKYVYVREDLLVRELMDRTVDWGVGKASGGLSAAVMSTVARIREAGLVIVHDGSCWILDAGR